MRDGLTLNMPLTDGTFTNSDAPLSADDVAQGVGRLLRAMGFAPMTEVKLGNSRRADVAGFNRCGMMAIVEIKTALGDLKGDGKWPDYLPFCDCFYFAVPPAFPRDLFDDPAFLPDRTGLIIADRFGAEILRDATEVRMNAGRRRAETLRFARKAAARLHRLDDPGV